MSTQPPPPPHVPRDVTPNVPGEQHKPPGDIEIRIFSHSGLFYWWPVWAAGFILGTLSLIHGNRLAIVPKDTKPAVLTYYIQKKSDNDINTFGDQKAAEDKKGEKGTKALLYPETVDRVDNDEIKKVATQEEPHFAISGNKNFGVMFAMVLLVVIVVTNVPLRGMWSLMVIVTLIMLSIIFALAGTWEWIFERFEHLAIFMNAGGYFFIAVVLLIMWALAVFLFDRQMYMVFTPGQFRMCQQIGGGEQVFSTEGVTLEKQRSDLFRHWILGLGSGDLTVKTVRGDHFDLHNVLFVGRKKAMIEDMMREKAVVHGH